MIVAETWLGAVLDRVWCARERKRGINFDLLCLTTGGVTVFGESRRAPVAAPRSTMILGKNLSGRCAAEKKYHATLVWTRGES